MKPSDLSPSLRQAISQLSQCRTSERAGWKSSVQHTVKRDIENGLLTKAQGIEVLQACKAYGKTGKQLIVE